jgi:uncharacterized metal-binding protein YceD (DUF177 family)
MSQPLWPLTHPLRVTQLSSKVARSFDLTPDAATRAALAQSLDILGIDQLRFTGEITPVGRHDFTLTGTLKVRVVQACVVTLAPVRTTLNDVVQRRFVRDYADPKGDEVEMPDDDTIEPLPEVIDVGWVAAEALALLLPEYPRAEGARLSPDPSSPEDPLPEADNRPKPFAGLAALAAKMAAKPQDPGENGPA